jgi:hypothetical protein
MLINVDWSQITLNRIGGVMVSVLASSEVDRWFVCLSGQTKDYEIGICCFSAKHAALRRKSKDLLARNFVLQHIHHGESKLHFNDMMMSALYYNTFSC